VGVAANARDAGESSGKKGRAVCATLWADSAATADHWTLNDRKEYPMPGGVSEGFHKGFNSEKWAESIFSEIGTAVRVPPSDDLGLDLYCTLMEREHPLLVPRGYYAVQVKSRREPWVFKNQRQVNWLIRYPLAIFYCVVNKPRSHISIFHMLARFYVWAQPQLPDELDLMPGQGTAGEATQWAPGPTYSLGAPILDFPIGRILGDQEFRGTAAGILKFWIDIDNKNGQHVSHNNHRFDMPGRYETNALPTDGRVIMSMNQADPKELEIAVSHLREPLDDVSRHLFPGDLLAAVRGMLLLRQLYGADRHAPSALGMPSYTLNALLGKASTGYGYQAIDDLGTVLDTAILRALNKGEHLRRVQRLTLTGKHVTDDVITPLLSAVELKRLILNDAKISDAAMKKLKGLSELETLSLSGTRITDQSLNVIQRFKQLVVLNLDGTHITSAGLRHLRPLECLENLYLSGTKIDDSGIMHLSKLPALDVLTLNSTSITDKGLTFLQKAPKLRKIELMRTKTTDAGVAALLKARPGLIVIPAPAHKDGEA
jgi:hypothetical protein